MRTRRSPRNQERLYKAIGRDLQHAATVQREGHSFEACCPCCVEVAGLPRLMEAARALLAGDTSDCETRADLEAALRAALDACEGGADKADKEKP